MQVEHRGAAAVAQVQRDLAGERGDVGHQARVGARAGRELQLQHALAGAAGDERDGDVRTVGDGRARERGAAGEVLVGLLGPCCGSSASPWAARAVSSPRSAGSSQAMPPAASNSCGEHAERLSQQALGRQVGGEVVGDRLLGEEEALRGGGGAAVLRAGVLAHDGGVRRVQVGLVGGAAGAAAARRRSASGSVSTSATPASSHVSRTPSSASSVGRQRADDRVDLAAAERARERARGRAAPSRTTALGLPFGAPSTSTSAEAASGSRWTTSARKRAIPGRPGSAGDFTTVFDASSNHRDRMSVARRFGCKSRAVRCEVASAVSGGSE